MSAEEADRDTIVDAMKFAVAQENRAVNAERDRDVLKTYHDTVSPEIEKLRAFLADASNRATVNL